MISVRGLAKRYGDVTAVDGVSFEVGAGEVFGLVGPNGAGKTSTLKMLCGLVDPSEGDITVNGYDAGETEMRRSLGFLPEESPLYDEMSPRSYLRFFADLYDVDRETADERIEAALDRLDLDARDRPVGDFSKGMKRKVAIARSLVNDPDVLVYDEPASGLDPITTNTVVEFTRELAADGKTVVFSAHDLHHVESVCDRVAIMRDGEIAATGTLADIRAEHGRVEYRVFTDVSVDGTEPAGDRYVTTVASMDAVEDLREAARDAGGEVVDIRTDESTLEDVFLDVAGA
ncbi:ABC transporter ATP-binding protein [Halobacterium litoreum]|uniref:ATP-binding cassette domain-containing protein n=1 Tax=Halobacterium litoreum TaxID=2039234 RepID=A0ABD5NHU8_9EURY|nr:ABC transporter ATP-binding protein [Halobacterium litoreum]UHH12327.1 ABC transporter ATP-binding protein [Halobacterium litoreum]